MTRSLSTNHPELPARCGHGFLPTEWCETCDGDGRGDLCIADDSTTECDCSICVQAQADWESDQGWDDDGDDGPDEDFDRDNCVDPSRCINPAVYHFSSECAFAPDAPVVLSGRQRTRRLWAKRGRR